MSVICNESNERLDRNESTFIWGKTIKKLVYFETLISPRMAQLRKLTLDLGRGNFFSGEPGIAKGPASEGRLFRKHKPELNNGAGCRGVGSRDRSCASGEVTVCEIQPAGVGDNMGLKE